MAQTADLVFNPRASDALRLTLVRKGGKRQWRRGSLIRRAPQGTAAIEGQLEWRSWHGGAGHGRISGTGLMPPVISRGDADVRWPGFAQLNVKITAEDYGSRIVHYFTVGGVLYAIGNDTTNYVLYNLDAESSSNLIAVGNGYPYSVVVFDNNAYIGWGFSANVTRVTAAGAVAQSGDNDVRWKFADVARDRLWFNPTDNTIVSVPTGSDPWTSNATWSGPTTVGDTNRPVTSICGEGRVLYIGRTDGLNALDEDLNLVNLVPDLKAYISDQNAMGMVPWNGGLVVPHQRGLLWYTNGLVRYIGPERIRSNTTQIRLDKIVALLADGEWLWVLGYQITETTHEWMLLKGRQRDPQSPGEGPLVWYEMATGTKTLSEGLRHPSSMLLHSNYVYLPLYSGHREIYAEFNTYPPEVLGSNITTFLLRPTGFIDLPIVDMGQPNVPKYLHYVEVAVQGAGPGDWVAIDYRLDPRNPHLETLNELGPVIAQNGLTRQYFPPNTECREVQLVITFNGTTNTPVLRSVSLGYSERSDRIKTWEADILLGRGVADREGNEMGQSADTLIARLDAMLDDKEGFEVIDPLGRTIKVLVLDFTVAEEQDDDDPQNIIAVGHLTLEEVG